MRGQDPRAVVVRFAAGQKEAAEVLSPCLSKKIGSALCVPVEVERPQDV